MLFWPYLPRRWWHFPRPKGHSWWKFPLWLGPLWLLYAWVFLIPLSRQNGTWLSVTLCRQDSPWPLKIWDNITCPAQRKNSKKVCYSESKAALLFALYILLSSWHNSRLLKKTTYGGDCVSMCSMGFMVHTYLQLYLGEKESSREMVLTWIILDV